MEKQNKIAQSTYKKKVSKILSTKKLTPPQKEILLHAKIDIQEYNAITIEPLLFDIQGEFINVIITSKNAFKAIKQSDISIKNCYCVGSKTKALLEKNNINVVVFAQNASDLAQIIAKNHAKEEFTFFCGTEKREELPNTLLQHNINISTIPVYTTKLNSQKIAGKFDGILFFSPSAVKSYTTTNKIKNAIAFCIGNTTASEAKKHSNYIITATQPTIEHVLEQVVKHQQNND